MIQIKITLEDGAMAPTRAHGYDAGFDLYALNNTVLRAQGTTMVYTGVRMDIPCGWYGKIETRSSMAARGLLVVGGIIDAGYQGEIKVLIYNHTDVEYTLTEGDRAAQLLLLPVVEVEWCDVAEFTETARGSNGFGSTGN